MLAFLTGVIIGVPVSIVSLKLINNLSDINDKLIIIDTKVETVLDNTREKRLPFEGRN